MKLKIGENEFDVQPSGDNVTVDGGAFAVRVVKRGDILTVYVNEKPHAIQLPAAIPDEGPLKVLVDAKEYDVELTGRAVRAKPKAAKKAGPAGAEGAVVAQMTGRVIRVDVKPGDAVTEGQVLLIIEAMKMENEITAPMNGTVKEVAVNPGARVSEGDMLVQIEPAGS